MAVKSLYESYADTCDVKMESYRADNERFAELSFLMAVKVAQHTIDFCAVSAHHQNGVIKWHFQFLTTKALTILLHAKRH